MAKTLLIVAGTLMCLSAVFGVLNTNKVKALHNEVATITTARDAANTTRLAKEKELKTSQTDLAAANTKVTDTETKLTSAQSDLAKAQSEKADAQTKLQTSEVKVAELEKRLSEVTPAVAPGGVPGPSAAELQAQLDEARKGLESAQRENASLADKVKGTEQQVASLQKKEEQRQRQLGVAGLRGTILAVNTAYNFVVLNLGDRQGVVPNSEMLIVRRGNMIGRIRISSVEPATAIGDIINNTLQGGTQVQPGDSVIYAGSNAPGANAPGPNAPGPNAPPAPGNS